LESCAAEVLPVGSVLLSSRAPIGLVAINSIPMATNQGFKSLIPKESVCFSGYLYHWLRANRPYLEGAGNGATFKEVSKAVVSRVKIPVPHKNGKPDLAEQKRIAAILDKADAIRRKRQQALRLTDDFLRSLFLDMFGDPVTNPKGLQTVGLFDVCEMISGATPSKARKDFWNGRIPWISPKDMKAAWLPDSIDHISAAALEETNIKLLKPNTVLIVIRGMILAHSFPVAQPLVSCTINQDMKGLIPKAGFNAHYIAWSLRCQLGNIMSKVSTAGHGTRRFDNNALRSLPVLIADPQRQEAFASIVENCRSLDRKTTTLLRCCSNLFSSVQQRAFKGEILNG
tara:strand:+ start:7620 stop:8645 length:1026 start_codon:yes stop_codon:yes gene_type:complete